jgi:c-di-GMP-binding flagellar brake protein YcgR
MTAENRRHPRYSVEVGAEVTLGPQTLSAATQNVSEGGVGLVLDEAALEEGARVRLTLFLTQDGIEDPDEEPFETPAVIAWTAPNDAGGQVAGARFGALEGGARAQLHRFLAALAE